MNFNTIFLLFAFFLGMVCQCSLKPMTSPQDIEAEMRQTPQTHCLRFRKFDMIRRCRRFRKSFPPFYTFRPNNIPPQIYARYFRYRVRRHR